MAAKQENQNRLLLTPRERECLIQALEGKELGEISKELQIDAKTVYYYLNGVKVKLAGFVSRTS
jgi:DNA-binding CsgD family transcriptional regulator